MRHIVYIMALLCMFLVSACASDEEMTAAVIPLPVTQPLKDPDNAQFMNAVAEYIKAKGGPPNTRYEFTRVDLNRDGRREGIVLMKAPHRYWCKTEGCSMAIFRAENEYFTLLSEVAPIRGPLLVSSKSTNGWSDIVVTLSGRMNDRTKDVALQFDGRGYPPHPAFQPQVRYAYNDFGGVRIFP